MQINIFNKVKVALKKKSHTVQQCTIVKYSTDKCYGCKLKNKIYTSPNKKTIIKRLEHTVVVSQVPLPCLLGQSIIFNADHDENSIYPCRSPTTTRAANGNSCMNNRSISFCKYCHSFFLDSSLGV
jgi:hypothetical protein